MRYPSKYSLAENEHIQKNDIVWLNEGTEVGFIYAIITEPSEWGLEDGDVGVMIQTLHPLNSRDKECSPGLVFNTEDQFEDEGIGKLSEIELRELQFAVSEAFGAIDDKEPFYTVSAIMDVDTRIEYWHISTFEDGVSSKPTRIKFRSGTRHQFD